MKFAQQIESLLKLVTVACACTEHRAERHGRQGGTYLTLSVQLDHRLHVVGQGLGGVTVVTVSNTTSVGSVPGRVTVQPVLLLRALRTLDPRAVATVEALSSARLRIRIEREGVMVDEHWLPLERPAPENYHPVEHATSAGLTLSRSDLLEAARVSDEVGRKLVRPAFRYWRLRADESGFRSVGGDGGYFVARERGMRPGGEAAAPSTAEVLIRGDQTASLVAALGRCAAEWVTIWERGGAAGNPWYVVVEAGNTTVVLADSGPKPAWPNEDLFLRRPATHRLTVRTEDLAAAVRGVRATRDTRPGWMHYARIRRDGGCLVLSTDLEVGCSRTVPLIKAYDGLGAGTFQPREIASAYLRKALRHADLGGLVHLEFDGGSGPMVVRFSPALEAVSADAPLAGSGTDRPIWVAIAGLRRRATTGVGEAQQRP